MKIDPSEITPEQVYLNRRRFIKGMGALVASSVLAACAPGTSDPSVRPTQEPAAGAATAVPTAVPTAEAPSPVATVTARPTADDLGNPLTPFDSVANYNNFYEFTFSKEGVADLAKDFVTSPWEVQVGGLVSNPKTFTMEELLAFEHEERIYRLRCVEAWSMVVPWNGFPLHKLLEVVEPTPEAKYVYFETLLDTEQFPGQRSRSLPWPYVEGLRLDEAYHDLTMLATGVYGKPLPPQNGAPIRLVVPWKYGFKYIKSIVKIDLVAEMPKTTWAVTNPREYGFYANVNPAVSHPRWSQASERVIGTGRRRKTLLFNGYEEEVAHLYDGMDLTEYF
jgi:sulfoxide reductase catalytic subunit YedY